MPSLLLNVTLAASMFAAQKFAADCFSYAPFGESYGYSSEEVVGGNSYLGVDTRDITADRLAALQLKEERGVEVTMVDQDAPAGKAGIKEHDVIMSVNGAAVESVEQLRRMIHEIPPGRMVTIGISRNGQPVTLKAQLASRKQVFAWTAPGTKAFKFAVPPVPPMPVMPDIDVPVSVVVVHSSARSGLMVENLTPQLGMFFGAKNGQGVLVRSVEKGSAAEKAGFKAGDVVVRVNDQAIADTGDFTHSLKSRKENTVTVGIIRDKKEQTLSLTLPERKRSELFDEESFEVPEIDFEAAAELGELSSETAGMQAEMLKYADEVKRLKPEIEIFAKQALKEQLNIQKSVEELKKNYHNRQKDYRRLLQQEFTGGLADI